MKFPLPYIYPRWAVGILLFCSVWFVCRAEQVDWESRWTDLDRLSREKPGEALAEAIRWLEDEGTKPEDAEHELQLLLKIARLEHSMRGSKSALGRLKRAETIAREMNAPGLLAETLDLLVLNHARNGDIRKAQSYLDEAMALRKRMDPPRNMGHSLYAKAITHWFEGDYAESLACGIEGIRLYKQGDSDDSTAAHLYNALGITSYYLGDYVRSMDYYEKSMELHQRLGNRVAEAALLSNIGEALARQGELERALDYHRRSYAMENDLGNIRGVAYSLNVIAETMGGLKRYAEMRDYAKQALVLHGNLSNPWGEAYSHRLIGEAEGKLDNWSNARSHLESAIRISESIQAREHLKEAHRVMSSVYERLDDPSSALHHYRQFKEVSDEILNRESQERIKELEVRFETETTREHLEYVQKEASLQSAQLGAERLMRRVMVVGVLLMGVFVAAIGVLYALKRRANAEIESKNRALAKLNGELERIVEQRTADLRQANAGLEAAKTRIEEADRLKSEFLMLMSHEYRTPLNIILGFAGLLHKTVDPEAQSMTQAILSSGQRLNELLTRILDFSEFDTGDQIPDPESLDLHALVEGTCQSFRRRADEKALRFRTIVADDTPLEFVGDRRRLTIILKEVIDNAVKFTDSGCVTVRVYGGGKERAPVPSAVFEVSDSGPGIAPEVMVQLFRPFTPGDASLKRSKDGVGLGLVMAQRLVEHLGGELSYSGAPGVGSTFKIWIPSLSSPSLTAAELYSGKVASRC
ncbi:MAG: tetratricopeptide repeat protein [Opitutales bacterium]|nr:tetratricopeptide repeat protein [Opitutales bacterium]